MHRKTTPLDSESLVQTSNLNPHWTIANFIATSVTSILLATAREIADHLGVTHNPFLLYGDPGAGKSHLLHAIVHAILASQPNTRYALSIVMSTS